MKVFQVLHAGTVVFESTSELTADRYAWNMREGGKKAVVKTVVTRKKKNPARLITQKGYKFFVVGKRYGTGDLCIESGWEYSSDAADAVKEHKENGIQGLKILTDRGLKQIGIDHKKNEFWGPIYQPYKKNPEIRDSYGKVIQRSRNLSGVHRYASKVPVKLVTIAKLSNGGGRIWISFSDKTEFQTDFASYVVMLGHLLKWKSVRGVNLEYAGGTKMGPIAPANPNLITHMTKGRLRRGF